MKRVVMLVMLALVLTGGSLAQNLPRFELSLNGGYGVKNVQAAANWLYDTAGHWSAPYYKLARQGFSSAYTGTSSGGLAVGGGLNFYFHPNIGIGFNVQHFRTSIASTTNSDMWWKWTSDSTLYYSSQYLSYLTRDLSFTGTDNYFQSIPISLDLIFRFGGPGYQGYLSLGPTLYMNKAFVESEIMLGLVKTFNPTNQTVDGILVPTDINQSWTSFGANIGGGLTIWVGPAFGFVLDARYYWCGKKAIDWNFALGTYTGVWGDLSYTFSGDDITNIHEVADTYTTVEIKPSFFQFALGFKIRLN